MENIGQKDGRIKEKPFLSAKTSYNEDNKDNLSWIGAWIIFQGSFLGFKLFKIVRKKAKYATEHAENKELTIFKNGLFLIILHD